ncbi:MAG: AAA family ATPase [Myxococcota bacterium]
MTTSEAGAVLKRLRDEVGRVIVGQTDLVDGLLIGLLAGGHVLVEGVPGLAKTTAVRTLAEALGLGFSRIQFMPDLLPGDLVGTPVYLPGEQRFEVRRGPVFSPIVLADEINRAPAKVQSALLEAMEERQVTIGDETLPLPDPFLVMATQNPIDLEGTYPLPEAQVDRFLLKLAVDYPTVDEELAIVARDQQEAPDLRPVATAAQVRELRAAAGAVHMADAVRDYAVRIVRATREPDLGGARLGEPSAQPAAGALAYGASPRASIFLVRAARARAFLDERDFVTPHDVKRVAPDVLRHRILLSYEAEADGITPDDVITALLAAVETP